jgi:two-component system sensor histidine kinase KdpD
LTVTRQGLVFGRIVLALGVTAGETALFVGPLPVTPTTVALSYLVTILLIATEWGLAEATATAVAASLAFNLYFLPPVGRLTIADPENWITFLAFLITAVVVSQLSGRSRLRALDAMSRQRDLERLYALSRGLLLADDAMSAPAGIARHVADAFELPGVALYDSHSGAIARAGALDLPAIETKLRDVARQAVALREPSGLVVTAVRLGGAPIGSLAIMGGSLSDTVLQSIANLVAIGLERARAREASASVEAARRSGELRAAVLDAVAHEFKTPLTSIRAAVSGLASGARTADATRELVTIIDEESDRLQRLVSDAIQMLRIEAGDFRLHTDRYHLAALVRDTIAETGLHVDRHTVVNRVAGDVLVVADAGLLKLALRQLLDNALKYSPPTSTIEIDATGPSPIEIVVRNSGPAIPEHEQGRIFERFFRGAQARQVPGSGIGLAIVRQIAQAHGGTLTVSSGADATEFRVVLPVVEAAVV